jgi:Cd2+/Zn2+-exporting ATPase
MVKYKRSIALIVLMMIMCVGFVVGHGAHLNEDDIKDTFLSKYIMSKIEGLTKYQQANVGAFIISSAPLPIFVIIVVFGIKNMRILDIMSSFAAGALIGDVFIHNLPEVFESKHHHEHKHHEHECGCKGHEHNHECCGHDHGCCCNHKKHGELFLFILGIVVFFTAFLVSLFNNTFLNNLSMGLYIISYSLFAYKIILKSLNNIKHGNIFDENFLMIVASIGAIIINEMLEANLVVFLFTVGEYFQNKALDKSTAQIASLNKLKVDYATLLNGEKVLVKDVNVGDLIVVKVGERIPLDGIIVDGTTSLDKKILTGESLPCDVKVNDEVLSGCINLNNVITIKVTKEHNESTTAKIIKLVEVASSKKSKTEKFITKFARIYTPIVFA